MPKPFNKYLYYENSVQTPEEHVRIFERIFYEVRGREAMSLKEDFCGTFLISCEWVKSHPRRSAIGVDLDNEPILYGKKNGFRKLSASEKKRVKILRQDVCASTKQKVDVIGAGNFSFNIFKTRPEMIKYCKAAYSNLVKDGTFVLEMVGGPGIIEKAREQKTYTVKEIGGKYTYYWDQKSFDPIHHYGSYAIHFKDPKGVFHRDCFTYDWRMWTIPELKEMMLLVGFKEVLVYWESADKRGMGTGEYVRMETADNDHAWIAFVVGVK